jgi:hypothetical protein
MIIGMDIGRNGLAVVCPLVAMPENIKAYLKKPDHPIFRVKPSHKDFDQLLNMNPTGLVMEPTGGWYSQIWAKFGEVHDIPVYWVGHADLKSQRGHFGFPNKYDDNDALCLAASYFDPQWIDEFGRRRFLPGHLIREVWPLRELVLEYYQVDKLINAVGNQLQQRLSYEFPELAALTWKPSGKGYIEAIAWMAGKQVKAMRDRQYNDSVAKRLGINFSCYTKEHADLHHSLELRQLEIEGKLLKAFDNPLFIPYLRALEPFNFGIGLKGLILYKVFPFEKFLVNGFPHIERYLSRSNHWQKRNISLQHFQAYFGLSRRIEQSGGKEKIKWSGSKLLRSKFYAWVLARVTTRSTSRLRNDLGEYLGAKWDDMKDNDKASGKDAITRVSFMATRILFQKLRDEIVF